MKILQSIKMSSKTNIMNLPSETRCKIYERCDVDSLLSFGETHPKFVFEIVRCSGDTLNKNSLFWWEAAKAGYINWIRTLIKMGINPNVRDGDQFTALHWATIKNKPNLVEVLIDVGANPNAKNSYGDTALHEAVAHLNIVKMLIKAHANVNSRHRGGWTPLHLAANCNYFETVKTLIAAGANPNIKDGHGQTAFDVGIGFAKNYLRPLKISTLNK
jgi:Ankyrin repeats (3 copies)/Ankyrin repeats (many copies)